jgi:hypothetical protein
MRDPVLIIGAHRSGTSATAHALQILGLQIGQRLDSHCEPKALQQLHEGYLRQVGASWHDPTPFLESIRTVEGQKRCVDYLRKNLRGNFARIFGYRKNPRGLWLLMRIRVGAPWGCKEPRLTLFAPAWFQIFPEARIVHILRDPLAAALSVRARELRFQSAGDPPTGKTDNLEYCLALVRTYLEVAERLAGSENYYRVHFEDIQAGPRRTLAEVGRFCGLAFTNVQLASAAATIRPPSVPAPPS